MNFSVNDYFSRFERIILNQNVDVFKVKNKSKINFYLWN